MRDLANAAGYSPFHAARLFKEVTGQTPFDYLRAARLSGAAARLRESGDTITSVAFDFVFSSHAGFTRAFTRQFGLAPRAYREQNATLRRFLPISVLINQDFPRKGTTNMDNSNKTTAIFVQVVERPARKLLLKRGINAQDYYAFCEEVGCDVWDVLCGVREALYEPVGLWLPEHLILPGTSKYVQGVELPIDYSQPVPEGYDLVDLPSCNMMVFQGEPYNDDVYEEAIGQVWEQIKHFDPTLYGYQWAPEAAPRFQLEPRGYRGYIEAWPVEPIG
ncbi:MAG: helix-turn-helix transcriptional regulator [Anaerolineaceae bacterium]|nr:helix-turn-helix transcriptional regulator [Anaerolineaceae bacterium]